MEFRTKQIQNKSVISVEKNKLIGAENETFQNLIQESISNGSKDISIDLSKVEYLSSWGIGLLVHAYSTCKNKNVNFQIENVNENVLTLLNQLKLTELFKIS